MRVVVVRVVVVVMMSSTRACFVARGEKSAVRVRSPAPHNTISHSKHDILRLISRHITSTRGRPRAIASSIAS